MVVMGALPLPCPTIPFLQSLPASDAPYVDSSGSACRPPSPSPPGAASICGALRNAHTATPPPSVGNGMEPVVDFLPHRHTSSRFVRPASTTTPRWCALRFFGFGSRVQSIKRQHTGRERRTYPFVRHCLVSPCVQALPKDKGLWRVGWSNPGTPARPRSRFIRVRGAWMCSSFPTFLFS
jgi:hypothetical protein